MPIVAVPVWTPVPPFPQLSERRLGTYNSKAYAFASHMSSVFMDELGLLVTCAYQNALWAQDRAALAVQEADLAMGYRNTATSAAATATAKRDEAVEAASTATAKRDDAVAAAEAAVPAAATATQARAEAVAAAAQAQIFATQQLKASSTTSLTPGAGSKTFAVEAGRSFVTGMYLVATSSGAPANKMSGTVVSYDSVTGALVIAVDAFAGAAARADWVIGVAAAPSGQATAYQDIGANASAEAFGRYRLTASLNLTLPASPADGVWVDVVNTSGTTTARILRNAQSINGLAEDLTIDANYAAFRLVYRTGYGWFTV